MWKYIYYNETGKNNECRFTKEAIKKQPMEKGRNILVDR
jgi:hypothetical protein